MRPPTNDNATGQGGVGTAGESELPEHNTTIRPAPGSIKRAVLDAMLSGQKLTSLDAWRRFGTSRLAALVHQLRAAGWQINSNIVEVETATGRIAHVACYFLSRGA